MSCILPIERPYLPSYDAAEYEMFLARQERDICHSALYLSPTKHKNFHAEKFRAARDRYWAAQDIARNSYRREFVEGKRAKLWL